MKRPICFIVFRVSSVFNPWLEITPEASAPRYLAFAFFFASPPGAGQGFVGSMRW